MIRRHYNNVLLANACTTTVCLSLIKARIDVLYNHASSELYSEQCQRERESSWWVDKISWIPKPPEGDKVLDYKPTQLKVTYMV